MKATVSFSRTLCRAVVIRDRVAPSPYRVTAQAREIGEDKGAEPRPIAQGHDTRRGARKTRDGCGDPHRSAQLHRTILVAILGIGITRSTLSCRRVS